MFVLGLLLILAAALVTFGALVDAGETATVEILGQTITTTAAGVFVAGLVTMLMFLIGLWAMSASFGRARRKRAERKAARRDHAQSLQRLEEERAALREENERLARELAERQSINSTATAPVPADGNRDATDATDTIDTTDTTAVASSTTGPVGSDERVIDHRTDLTSHDGIGSEGTRPDLTASDPPASEPPAHSGRHRDPI